ncbi:PhzF family phenazine biosynthesis isomerase [Burkholderia sp. AU28942]|uniref:PhzF family phenazine biosynthesis protein n=1 Tax=Burkholderia TaxID=32008 RepID=UPI000841EB66|nr:MULTISPECIES: PhzF family phenazine biosynthesis isomerase [Burkholderia]AOK06361.1 phenazine biosynthesis protein [Burkholderia latens]MCA8311992.1 PhzF family phenazine biosynthesis isomerase [Burkholderia sp. AU28942]
MSIVQRVRLVRVFSTTDEGGNPAPVVLDANGWSDAQMKEVARRYGLESGFVMRAVDPRHDFRFRFFVPNHEMEMCGHAALGALWLLRQTGAWRTNTALIETLSGSVEARYDASDARIEVSQPAGRTEPVVDVALIARTLDVLNLVAGDLLPVGIVNATTSRTKTLVPVRSTSRLNAITPKLDQVEGLCDALSSTGLYPFSPVVSAPHVFEARQFPRASGYPEDAATGIAAAALLYGAHRYGLVAAGGRGIVVRQGVAMGRPSAITVNFRDPADKGSGCWLSGPVCLIDEV